MPESLSYSISTVEPYQRFVLFPPQNLQIEYKDEEYTWDDLCAYNSAPYQFPCLRMSAMDLFQEARWTFTTMDRVAYYRNEFQKNLLRPRLPRFAVMYEQCMRECGAVLLKHRKDQLALFSVIGDLEYSDECKICIESNYELYIPYVYNGLVQSMTGLAQMLELYKMVIPVAEHGAVDDIISKVTLVVETTTKDDIVDFLGYYVIRDLYAELGAPQYMKGYAAMQDLIKGCKLYEEPLRLTCPAESITITDAYEHLKAHADNAFNKLNVAGSAFPFWSKKSGDMFADKLGPFSGSGVDMSADMDSLSNYLMDATTNGKLVVPGSDEWNDNVERNPLYSWFMAGVTPANPEQGEYQWH